jgi:hypothetical protein
MGQWSTASHALNICVRPVPHHDPVTPAAKATGQYREWITEQKIYTLNVNPLNDELNPICYLLALLGAHHFLHVSRIRVKSLTLTLLMSYIYIWSTYS